MKTYKQFIQEAKQVGSLYHYTSFYGAKGILDDNILYGSDYDNEENEVLSTTRNKHFHKKGGYISIAGRNTRITSSGVNADVSFELDGDKLSNNSKIAPYNDYDGNNDNKKTTESEEQVRSPLKNFKSFVKKIRVHGNATPEDLKELQKHNIPIEHIP